VTEAAFAADDSMGEYDPSSLGVGQPGGAAGSAEGGGAAGDKKGDKRENSHGNRKEWSLLEDQLIVDGVRRSGCRWRQIAAMLPGRSDDAVRNRWNRLKEAEVTGPSLREPGQTGGGAPYHCSKCGQIKKNHRCTAVDGSGKDGVVVGEVKSEAKKKPERVGWTRTEDAIITQSVEELGHRWFHIAERLPGRTDHAIRNRWHRLQSMRHDALQAASTSDAADGAMPRGPSPLNPEYSGAPPSQMINPLAPEAMSQVPVAAGGMPLPAHSFSDALTNSQQGALIADCLDAALPQQVGSFPPTLGSPPSLDSPVGFV